MNKARLHNLLHQYLNGLISEDDCIELLDYIDHAGTDEIADAVTVDLVDLEKSPQFGEQQTGEIFQRIQSDFRFKESSQVKKDQTPIVKLYKNRWLQIAAACFLLLTGGVLYFSHQNKPKTDASQLMASRKTLIVPGSNKAFLTMANGKIILLSNASNGVLAKTNSGNISKIRNGQIVYNTTGAGKINDGQSIGDNILTTPKGGEYEVVLPDGTKVWLNAASSLNYPVAFTGNDRQIKLIGEAYFEVAKNKDKPFYVNINNVQVRVLGTHFNVEAYNDDENIKTTLLEGSVQISKNNTHSILAPGQQAVINKNSNNIVVSTADIDDAMAWKNGYFIFDHDNIQGIMKKVSRWYDVDVTYQGNFTDLKFGGTFYRSKSVEELLQHLESVGNIHFAIKGRRIIVMN
ncbi:FecR family protein [Mucilaginibacter sp. HC2]|uniref:FecR family protein n=1 Tax=Mucilaginibacter inviolabilis TaxID=2714892 RepID=UPI00140869A6|nr:FecR domain-containing protein [Mucilaginibacter inviolabilis]NHA02363.1 FecR family protein [Mucilaginibacter inviolabilis]